MANLRSDCPRRSRFVRELANILVTNNEPQPVHYDLIVVTKLSDPPRFGGLVTIE